MIILVVQIHMLLKNLNQIKSRHVTAENALTCLPSLITISLTPLVSNNKKFLNKSTIKNEINLNLNKVQINQTTIFTQQYLGKDHSISYL